MRRFLLVLLALAACILAGALLAQRESRFALAHLPTPAAYGVTPAPWLSVAAPFQFCYRYPDTLGCALPEDKTQDPYVKGWKIDVDRNRADCLRWTAVGAVPAAQLALDATCLGGTRLAGGIYWFDAPTAITPPPPSPSPPASLPPPAATATLATTATPGPVVALPMLSPHQLQSFTVSCNPPGSPLRITIHGSRELVVGVDRDECGPFYAALLELLRRLAERMPAQVEVRD